MDISLFWNTIIISPLTNILLIIYQIAFSNYGLAIILFTCLIRLVTHPLMVQQIKGAQAMQDMQKDPRYVALQAKHKGDKQKLQEEQAKMMQELKINPLASCLPTLIQFPIIIGLYQVIILALANSPMQLENLIRHIYPRFINVATLIPLNSTFLWMDLSQPERLFIPGIQIGIPVLAIIVVITTYMQSKMMTPTSSNSGDQSAMVGNMMNIYMPFLMGYLALTLASGLALYFVVSNLIGIFQYAMLGKLNWRNLLPMRKSSAVVKGGTKK